MADKKEKEAIKFKIVEQIEVLSESKNGWVKEANLVQWGDNEPKVDIRSWSKDHSRMGKGITLDFEELQLLLNSEKLMELDF
jgi:hypothetical protein